VLQVLHEVIGMAERFMLLKVIGMAERFMLLKVIGMAARFKLLKVIGMAARAGMIFAALSPSIAACCSERRPSRHGVSTPLINPFGSVAWPPAPVCIAAISLAKTSPHRRPD